MYNNIVVLRKYKSKSNYNDEEYSDCLATEREHKLISTLSESANVEK